MSEIHSFLKEARLFPPPPAFSDQAHVKSLEEYREIYARSINDPEGFWAEQAETLTWQEKWHTVLDWKVPFAKWFVGGKLNLSENCLDRHASTWRKNKAAIIWEGEPGEVRVVTYGELLREVCKFANVLKSLGVEKGDRVGIYLPMIPEAAVAMLACARIGAVHSVVFGGFSAEAVSDRMNDAEAKLIVTADGACRRGNIVHLEGQRGRGVQVDTQRREGRGGSSHRRDHRNGGRSRCLVPRGDGHGVGELPARAPGLRTSSLHSLYLRHHRKAEGGSALDRGLSASVSHDLEVRFRPQGRRHLLLHGRRGLGHRSQLRGLRAARERRDVA